MAHVEPMDLDCIESDFDDKENSYQHNNALPRVSCAEKGFEELDVSEFNMKLRYQVTPASSPMSKSYTANCLDNRNISSVEDVLTNNQNLTRSLNSTITNSDSILKSPKSLPLQSISTDQFTDLNRNSSIRRSLDNAKNNVTVTITTPQDLDDNLSLPSTSSSLTHTPEATTPTKEIPKHDGGSPILRGLKSVFSMFRSSQSPIPPHDETNVERKDETFSEVPVKDTKPQTVLASTPIRSKNSPIKSGSPLKDSVTFKDDLERELQWRDDSTIIFKEEKIPIHKLFLPTLPIETKAVQELKKDNVNTTVEYMDISINESAINESVKNIKCEANNTIESDSEFQDCETTFTKNEDDLAVKADVNNANVGSIQDDINMSIVENEYNETKPEEPQIESLGHKTIDLPIECTISGVQTVAEDNKLNLTNNLETNTKLEDVVPDIVENVDNKNKAEEEILLETPINSISNTTLNKDNLQCEQNLSAVIHELNEISSDAKCVEDNLIENVNNKHESNGICNQSNINMSIVENEHHEVNSDQSKILSDTQVEINANETTNLENPIVENIIMEDIIPEGLKLDETVNIEASSKLLNSTSPDINESSQTKNMSDTQIGEEGVSHKVCVDETIEKTIPTELEKTDYICEQSLHGDENSISNETTNDIKTDSRMELNSMESVDDLHANMISNELALQNITELQTTNVANNSVDELYKFKETSEIPKHEDIEQNTDQNIDEALILTNKSECVPTLSNEEKVDITPSLPIHTPDIQTHVENITEVVVEGDTLLNNIQSEAINDPAKTICSDTETSSHNVNCNVPNEFEEENQLGNNVSLTIPVDNGNVNDKTVEINSENFTIETKCTDVNCVNTSNAENTTLSQVDSHVLDSRPSDIPLPFDDENMPSLNNEIEITNKANTNDEETEMQFSDLPVNTTIIQESLNIEGDSNVESTISQNNIDNLKTLHALEIPIEPEILPEVVDSNEIEKQGTMI
ncbi:unnamed protein product [Colias eurytheme]|nr:unnamed protein product [Colias eurytheme]